MSWLLTFPLILPFATAVLAYLARKSSAGRWISVAGSLLALVAALALFVTVSDEGVVSAQMGGWDAPYGITLVADMLSAVMVLLTTITGLSVAIYAMGEINPAQEKLGYHSIFQILLGGITGAFLTGDLFNLYVWFEVMLIASFGLLIMGGKPTQIDGAVKYVTLNLIATVMFLSGIGLLYGVTGTLNMADLHDAVLASDRPGLIVILSMFFLIAFGMKAAVFPLFSWLPASYHTPTFAASAIFSALLTKVGVYSLLRTFTLIFTLDPGFTNAVLLWVAVLTMVVGVIGALAQTEIRRILSFQIVSSIGFLILGLAIHSPLAITGAVFYLIHNVIVKANLFLVSGVIARVTGGTDLRLIGGMYRTAPLLSVLFLIPAFALSGFPPLSGFWPKVLLVKASLDQGMWVVAAVALIVSLLTILSLMTLWSEAFWKPHPEAREPSLATLGSDRLALVLPIAALGLLTLLIGVFPQPILEISEQVAAQLLSPDLYLTAVRGVLP
ncbi:Na+/H+ antiporter subunit D [Pseudoruegeria sp. SK021]|uniref:Na+/H+ antiporter subunit D n=1 Tax=Pseudoruegeria sp. SK021 TaxID=1933035 RepID=UPI000A244D25|nr:Na+/H+ antiporter subunit D [Pseudoruegeria sp. SK021]OSP56824.1 Na+/H+ antiporter subunit D [Pseudoruegeria sp. SK021]